jgi:hypothetical protein
MKIAGLIFVALLAIIGTVAALAPAQWAAAAVRSATDGRVDLAETTGSLWHGQATVVLSSGSDAGGTRASLPEPTDRAVVEPGPQHDHVLIGALFEHLTIAMHFRDHPPISGRQADLKHRTLPTETVEKRCP